jgi:hypothetical protein
VGNLTRVVLIDIFQPYALVAQLDRALDSGSKGRGFESSQARLESSGDLPPGLFLFSLAHTNLSAGYFPPVSVTNRYTPVTRIAKNSPLSAPVPFSDMRWRMLCHLARPTGPARESSGYSHLDVSQIPEMRAW